MNKQFITILTAFIFCAIGWYVVTNTEVLNQASPTQTATTTWQTYENTRFNYALDVPNSFTTEEGFQNNDGRLFTGSSGSTTVRVYARNNTNNQSLTDFVGEQTQKLDSLEDAQVGSSSAILYGIVGGESQVTKLLYRQDVIALVRISNPQSALRKSEESRLLESFRWSDEGSGNDQQSATPTNKRPVMYTPDAAEQLIRVKEPGREQEINAPLKITGEARGQWFFEADAPVVLTDWDGRILAEGYIQADGEWMTDEFVPFSGELEFEQPERSGPQSVRGSLIIQRANPSGQPENDMAVEIPVRFDR